MWAGEGGLLFVFEIAAVVALLAITVLGYHMVRFHAHDRTNAAPLSTCARSPVEIHTIHNPPAPFVVIMGGDGLLGYFQGKIDGLEIVLNDKAQNLRRLEAQRNQLNTKVRRLREELQLLYEPGSYVGEVIKVMGKNKVLVKLHPEGKYVVKIDDKIDVNKLTPGTPRAHKKNKNQPKLHKKKNENKRIAPFFFFFFFCSGSLAFVV